MNDSMQPSTKWRFSQRGRGAAQNLLRISKLPLLRSEAVLCILIQNVKINQPRKRVHIFLMRCSFLHKNLYFHCLTLNTEQFSLSHNRNTDYFCFKDYLRYTWNTFKNTSNLMEVNLPVMETQRKQNTDEGCSLISWKVANLLLP